MAQNRRTRAPLNAARLLEAGEAELDDLFAASPPGEIPRGRTEGTAILIPGSIATKIIARAAQAAAWRGKVFAADGKTVMNRIGPFGTRAIRGAVYPDRSWVDGKNCIVIDYSTTSIAARGVRDEIRLVAPRLYLGVVWLWRRRVAWFALTLPIGAKREGL